MLFPIAQTFLKVMELHSKRLLYFPPAALHCEGVAPGMVSEVLRSLACLLLRRVAILSVDPYFLFILFFFLLLAFFIQRIGVPRPP